MIAYLDTSVLLRLAFNQADSLQEFSSITRGIASQLIKAESLRTLDRLFIVEKFSEADQSRATSFIFRALDRLELIPVDPILEAVGTPMGLKLGTLDAIHLFSALKWKEIQNTPLTFLTHDRELAFAARRFGFEVMGDG